MNAYLHLTRAGIRGFFRDKQGVFWSFFFPLFFIFIFGTIFGQKKDGPQMQFKVGLVVLDPSPAAAWVPKVFRSGDLAKILKTTTGSLKAEQNLLKEGKRDAVIVFPVDFGVKLLSQQTSDVKIFADETQPQTSQMVMGLLRNVISNMELGTVRRLANARNPQASAAPLFRVSQESLAPTGNRAKEDKLNGIDFLLPGILAMTVMQLGLFTAIPFINMREKGILKRLRATPLPRMTIIGSQVTQRLFIGVLQTMVILAVGLLFFKFHMTGSWPALLAIIIFGVFTFIGIASVLASIAKTQESGVSMVQLVNFPMMFLSGMFIPLQILPEGMRSIVGVLPATHLANLLRHVMVDAPLTYTVPVSFGVMAAWLLGGLLIAARTFRWE